MQHEKVGLERPVYSWHYWNCYFLIVIFYIRRDFLGFLKLSFRQVDAYSVIFYMTNNQLYLGWLKQEPILSLNLCWFLPTDQGDVPRIILWLWAEAEQNGYLLCLAVLISKFNTITKTILYVLKLDIDEISIFVTETLLCFLFHLKQTK